MNDFNDLIEQMLGGVEEEELKNSVDELLDKDSFLDRQIILGDIGENTGMQVDAIINFWNRYDDSKKIPEDKRKPIKLIISSYGGSLTSCFTIIDSIKMSKTPVYGYVIGVAYSAGFFISIACHKRFAYPLSSFLFHEGSIGGGGTQTAAQAKASTDFYKMQLKQLKTHVLSNTNISKKLYKEMVNFEDYYLTAEQALELGCIDEILEYRKKEDKTKIKEKKEKVKKNKKKKNYGQLPRT